MRVLKPTPRVTYLLHRDTPSNTATPWAEHIQTITMSKCITLKGSPPKTHLCQSDYTTSPDSITIWNASVQRHEPGEDYTVHSLLSTLDLNHNTPSAETDTVMSDWEWAWMIGFHMKAMLPVIGQCIYQFSHMLNRLTPYWFFGFFVCLFVCLRI